MMRIRTMLAIISLNLGAVWSGTAQAYRLERVDGDPCGTAQNVFWKDGRAVVDSEFLSPPNTVQLANDAADAWNASLDRFRFVPGHATGFCDETDGVISMGFATSNCDGSAFGPDVVALASYRFFLSSGEFTNADIAFNSSGPGGLGWADQAFLQTAIHELGHTLGLDHSDTCGDSGEGTIMKSVFDMSGPFLSAPQADDISGANVIYAEETPPCSGDCNDDKQVTVDEILTMVNVALGSAPVTECTAGDLDHNGQITVDEVLAAVNKALNGCS